MARQRHLDKAPITEALVDFRANLQEDFQPTIFAKLKSELAGRYPVVQEIREFEARFQVSPLQAKAPEVSQGRPRGFFFKSQDGLNIAQFRVDGFTYNRLQPYTSWAHLFPEALELWNLYVSIARPIFVSRVALRYINHLKLQIRWGDSLGQFLASVPPMPPGAPGGYSGFVSRVSTFDPETGLAANVSQALEGGPEASVVLDIDVFKDGEFESGPGLVPLFDRLHQMKNDIFFGSITEETARRYE